MEGDDIIKYYEISEKYAFELPEDDPVVDLAKQTWGQPLQDEPYLSSQLLQDEIDGCRKAEEAIQNRFDKDPDTGGAIVSVNSPDVGTALLHHLLRRELSAMRPVILHRNDRTLLFITNKVFQFINNHLFCSLRYCGVMALIDSCHGDLLYEPLAVVTSARTQLFPVQVVFGDTTLYRRVWKRRYPVRISVPEVKWIRPRVLHLSYGVELR